MKRVAYAEAVVGMDAAVADRVLEYATRLATAGSADTVHVPAVVDDGPVQQVAMLLGPASQIAVWEDDAVFPGSTADALADLDRRIGRLTATIPTSPEPEVRGLDDLDQLDVALPDE